VSAIIREFLAKLLVLLLFLQPIASSAQDVAASSISQVRSNQRKAPASAQAPPARTSITAPAPLAISTPGVAAQSRPAIAPPVLPQARLTPQVAANLANLPTKAPPFDGGRTTTQTVSLPPNAKLGTATPDSTKPIISRVIHAKPKLLPADATDPYIIAQASALANDQNKIFAFVRDQISLDVYMGSVRGARGTLWSKAGNSLDKSNLLVALLGAAGISATYAQGTLTATQQKTLILSMFPNNIQIVGCPTFAALNSPQLDATLTYDLKNHFWVQVGGLALDPSFAGATPGQVFGTVTTTFSVPPDALRQQVTLRLNAEIYSQAAAVLSEQGLGTTTVLQQTFFTDTLAGRPISVGNAVNQNTISALVISSSTITYSPYFLLGQGDTDITQDPIVYGQDYQEVYTSFPLGSQLLTGLFLEVDTQNPNLDANAAIGLPGPSIVTYTRSMFDRIGYAARQGLVSVSVSPPTPPVPAFTTADTATVNVLPGFQSSQGFQNQQTRLTNLNNAIQAIQPQVQTVSTPSMTPAQQQIQQQASHLSQLLAIAVNELITMSQNAAADVNLASLQNIYLGHAYYTTPRLTVGISSVDTTNNVVGFKLDLLKNDDRFEAGPQQSYPLNGVNPGISFEINRGIVESGLEAITLSNVTGKAAIGIAEVIAALAPGKLFSVFTTANSDQLAQTSLSPDAQARILTAIGDNKAVLAPTHMVTINGITTVAWYETDLTTGQTLSAFPDGGHQGLVEEAVEIVAIDKLYEAVGSYLGYVEGIGVAGILFAAAVLDAIAGGGFQGSYNSAAKAATPQLKFIEAIMNSVSVVTIAFGLPEGFGIVAGLVRGMKEGIESALKLFESAVEEDDPDAPDILSALVSAPPAAITPGTSPGVNLTLVPDTDFTASYNGLSLPLNYRLQIQNTGPTDTFNISSGTFGGSFSVTPSISPLTIPAGQTATVGICLVPSPNQAPQPPGTPSQVTIDVSDKSFAVNKSASATVDEPTISSVQLLTSQPGFDLVPGGSSQTTLSITSTGNVAPGTVTLTASVPSAVTLSGLSPSVDLFLQPQVLTNTLTVSANSGATPGIYPIVITATTGSGASAIQASQISLNIQVATAGTCTGQAASEAIQLNAGSLAAALQQLASDEALAAQNPADPAAPARLSADLGNVINTLDAQYLQPYIAQLQTAQSTFSTATPATLPSLISSLDSILCNMGTLLTSAYTSNFGFSLQTTQAVANATTPSVFPLNLFLGSTGGAYPTRTFDLKVTGLPAGATSAIIPTVTLNNSQPFSNNLSVTITPNPAQLVPFTFTVTATPEDTPQFSQSVTGNIVVSPESINIDEVTLTDTTTDQVGMVANAGDLVDIKVRIYGVVNEQLSGLFFYNINAANGNGEGGGEAVSYSLTPAEAPQVVDITPGSGFNTTALEPGVYKISVVAGPNINGIASNAGTGYFVIGSPINATLTASPSIVNPPSATITTTLSLTKDAIPRPDSTFLGSATLSGATHQVILNGTDAYVCSSTNITRVDVSNPASPVVLNTFATDVLGTATNGYGDTPCAITGNNLILQYSRPVGSTAEELPTNIVIYDISNPASPVQKGTTGIKQPDAEGLQIVGTKAYTTTEDFFYCPICGDTITQQNGDYLVFDITTPTSPVFDGDLFPTTPNADGFTYGGPHFIYGFAQLNATTALLTSSTSTGSGVSVGEGNLITVNSTTPSAPTVANQIQVPEARLLNSIAVQGNLALVTGDTAGFTSAVSGFTGTLTLTLFDITSPNSPVIKQTLVTTLKDNGGASVVSLGNYMFAVGGATINQNNEPTSPLLLFVDASQFNPANNVSNPTLVYVPYDVPQAVYPSVSNGGIFYATTPTGISIYQLTQTLGPQVNVTMVVPTSNGVSVVPSSFSPAPTQTLIGSGSNTYIWNQPASNTITFNENVTNMQPGLPVPVVLTGSVDFVEAIFGNGSIPLGPLTILPAQILNISPASQSVTAGQPGSYDLTVSNPTGAGATYNLNITGVPAAWVQGLPPSVTVAGLSSSDIPLTITPPINQSASTTDTFTVTAVSSQITGSVSAQLSISPDTGQTGPPNVGQVSTTALAMTATPNPITIGLGQSLPLSIVLINAGTTSLTPFLSTGSSATGLITFNPPFVPATALNSGASLTQPFTLMASPFAPLGPSTISITAQISETQLTLTVPVNVVPNGVTATLSGTSSPYTLTVTNTGIVDDTYDLAATGVFAGITTLGSASVFVSAGTSQTVSVTLVGFAGLAPGSPLLVVTATSEAVPAVFGVATLPIAISPLLGVSAVINPNPAQINGGSAGMTLQVTNTGNVDDSYTAAITGTTGSASATLNPPTGTPGPSVQFRAGAIGGALVPMTGSLASGSSGTVTVTITSLTNSSIKTTATATITNTSAELPPNANAGTAANIPLHRIAILDGTASNDPNLPALPLTYAWSLVSAPGGSAVTTASIRFPTSPEAVFTPDVAGPYTFKLTVTNSVGPSSAMVTDTAMIFPPVAVAGKAQNAKTGGFVFLNGQDSYDPNSLPITFQWSFKTLPGGSALTAASLLNSATPKAFFTCDVNGSYVLQLIVNNGTLASVPNLVSINCESGALAPDANAGHDRNVKVSATVTLDGSASSDPNNPPLGLGYSWTFQTIATGSALTNAQITNPTSVNAQFAPDVAGDYVLKLTVSNSAGPATDTVTVHAFSGNVPPNASVGADQYAVPASLVNLDGSASSDPDRGPLLLSYNWWLNALPPGSTAALVNPTQAKPQFTPDVSGYFIARLEASDGLASGFANTLVTAAQKCDADANGTVNQIDINLITAAVGQPALPNDPRDPLGSGSVTAGDLSYCEALIAPKLPNAGSTPPSLTFTGAVGTTPNSKTLTVTSSGTNFSFTVGTDQTWLMANPGSGSTSSNTITVSVVTTNLAATTFNGNVIITATGAANSPFKIPVKLILESTSIAAAAGTPQIADVSTQFAIALKATVSDANGPVPGATVTFTAPSTGVSGTFPGKLTAITAVTNPSGLATASAFTANSTAGNYTVTATVDGAASPANFALTNAVPGSTSLGGLIGTKSGPQSARVWVFEVGNNGPGSALDAEITGITLVQTAGAACRPVITSPATFPLAVGNIAPKTVANVNVTIDFTGCAVNAMFKVTAPESANNGAATGTIIELNQLH